MTAINPTAVADRVTPLYMVYLQGEDSFGPDLWAEARAGRSMFLDPDKHKWMRDQEDEASMFIDLTCSVEPELFKKNQEYRLEIALEYIDSIENLHCLM